MNYVEALDFALEVVEDTPTKEKLEQLKGTLTKPRKKKVNTEKLELADKVYDYMDFETTYTATELADEFDISVQKLSAIMKYLIEQGKVSKDMEKRKTVYLKLEVEE